jgi:hypothetical protein
MNTNKMLNPEALFIKGRSRLIPDWYLLFNHLFAEGVIHKEDAKKIIITANKFFSRLIRQRAQPFVLARPGDHCRRRPWSVLRHQGDF